MDVKGLLNTDVSTLFHGGQRLWNWWLGELRAMLPGSVQSGPKARLIAEFQGDTILFREYRRNSTVALPRRGVIEHLLPQSAFALPSSSVLVRDVDYPALPLADLRRITALDMDRLTPFCNEDVVFDLEVRPGQNGQRKVRIGIVRRHIIDDVLARLWLFGAEPLSVGLVDRQDGALHFDFLKAAQLRGSRPLLGLWPAYWWFAAILLFVVNVALLVAKDTYSLDGLRSAVDEQHSAVVMANSLRRRVEEETGRRKVVQESLMGASPLAILDAVTKTLPDGAWVQRFEWNGKQVKIVGHAPPDQNIAGLMKASSFLRRANHAGASEEKVLGKPAVESKNPAPGATSVPTQGATGMFDVTVALRGKP
jgi:general secretion pathway protein L